MKELPDYAQVVRTLMRGEHRYVALLPRIAESPATRRIESNATPIAAVLSTARIRIRSGRGYVWVDDEIPEIVLIEKYYRTGESLDLYLDLLHELTHLRQLMEGHGLWNEALPYVDRPTEVEGYAVAVEEGRRLGMTEDEITHHLSNPWMSESDVRRLRENVESFLLNGKRSRQAAATT